MCAVTHNDHTYMHPSNHNLLQRGGRGSRPSTCCQNRKMSLRSLEGIPEQRYRRKKWRLKLLPMQRGAYNVWLQEECLITRAWLYESTLTYIPRTYIDTWIQEAAVPDHGAEEAAARDGCDRAQGLGGEYRTLGKGLYLCFITTLSNTLGLNGSGLDVISHD